MANLGARLTVYIIHDAMVIVIQLYAKTGTVHQRASLALMTLYVLILCCVCRTFTQRSTHTYTQYVYAPVFGARRVKQPPSYQASVDQLNPSYWYVVGSRIAFGHSM